MFRYVFKDGWKWVPCANREMAIKALKWGFEVDVIAI